MSSSVTMVETAQGRCLEAGAEQERGRVLLIAYNWPPDGAIGSVRAKHIATGLDACGWRPYVLTVQEQYYESRDERSVAHVQRFHTVRTKCFPPIRDLYRAVKAIGTSKRNAQSDHNALPMSDEHTEQTGSFLGRLRAAILSLMYTPDEHIGWLPFGVVSGIRTVRKNKIDSIISTGPPFTAHLVALVVKKLCRVRWVADFRDPWVGNEARGFGPVSACSTAVNRRLERWVMRAADAVVSVTPAMTEYYRQRYPDVKRERWNTITNGFSAADFADLKPSDAEERFTISHVGSIEYGRTPEPLFQAMKALCQAGAIPRNRVRIRLLGRCQVVLGRPIEELIAEHDLNDIVQVCPAVPRPEALQEMRRANALLLLATNQRMQIPGKAYEYIAAGRPILAVTEEESATAQLMRQVHGVVASPADVGRMKNAILSWFQGYMETAAVAQADVTNVSAAYDWAALSERYARLLSSLSESARRN